MQALDAMPAAPASRNWIRDGERDSVTTLYVPKPPPQLEAIAAPVPPPIDSARWTPSVRSFEVTTRDVPALASATPRRDSAAPSRASATAVKISFAVACVCVGVAIGGVIAFRGEGRTKPAPAQIAAPKSKSIVVAPIAPAPAAKAARITVRIESEPAGATAMLVDDGRTTVLGTTPLHTDLDPKRTYEVVLSHDGYQPRVQRVDPSTDTRIGAKLAPQR